MPVKPFRHSTPKQRNNNSTVLVRVGETAFTYEQIAARLDVTRAQAQGKVQRIRARKTNNQVTWETLGLASDKETARA